MRTTPLLAALLALAAAETAFADPALVSEAMRWRELGPFRGGWATMAAGIPDQPDSFYFSAAGGGLWRTSDAGRTWAPLFQHGPAASIGAFAIAPSDPKVIYIGTGQPEPRYDIAAGQGVFRSDDGGRTFAPLGLSETKYIGKIWVDPHDANTVLVGAQGHFFGPSAARGIYRSTDGGRSWAHVLTLGDWTGVVDIAADPGDPRRLFAAAWEAHQYPWQSYFTPVTGAGSAIYSSGDGGVTWQRLGGRGWPAAPLGRISLATARTSAGALRLYATVDGGRDHAARGLYRSDDGGASWTRANEGEAFTNYYSSRIAVSPTDVDVIYTVGQSIRRCTKGGASCTIIKGAPGGDDYHFVWINPKHPDHMITASDQGTVVSVNGGATWSDWYNQPTVQLYHLAADNQFPYWIYAGQQDSGTIGIASRSDYGAIGFRDWHPVGGDERDCDIPDPTDPAIVYASGLGGRVTKWDAHTGQVRNISPWPVSSYGKRPTDVRYHYLWVSPLTASRTGTPTLYLGAQVLFRSTDRGTSWQVISPDLTGKRADAADCGGNPEPQHAKDCGYGSIAVIEPSPREAGTIWVGTDDGLIERTEDGGDTWRNVTPPQTRLWEKIAGIDLSAATPGTAYAVLDGQRLDDFAPHILRTTDDGASWTDITGNLPAGHFATVLRSDPVRPGLLYAGTDAGVWVSFSNGGTWTPLQRNLPTAWVRDLLVHGGDLIAGTQGRGIWVLDDLSPLRQAPDDLAGESAYLFAPAPAFRVHPDNNADTPLPPETPLGENPPAGAVIDYWIGTGPGGRVTLDIADATGTVVRHFASDATPAPVPAGRYFAKSWTEPPPRLSGDAGMHRFVWDLRGERPPAISYTYSIAAVAGRDTPALPLGPWVLPGDYTVTLRANGVVRHAKLHVAEDPRVMATPDELAGSAALSARIGAALARNRVAYAEEQAVLKQLDGAAPAALKEPRAGTPAPAVPDLVRAFGDSLRKPASPGQPDFETIDEILAGIETDLEAVDAAPTPAQTQVVNETIAHLNTAEQSWADAKTTKLPAIDAALAKAGKAPITIPAREKLSVPAPDAGEDLP